MSDTEQHRKPTGRRRVSKAAKNTVTTKSGKTLRVNQSLGGRIKAKRDEKARAKAAYLATLPKERWKRILYRLHPKRVAKYWFSKKGALMALKITGVGIVSVFILMIAVFAYFRKDLPQLNDINSSKFGGSITYYDRTGTVRLYEDFDTFKRVPVQYDDMNDNMRYAIIAIEDKNFYNHGAFDVSGLIRAGINDVFGSGGRQGGSTITQQLVKMDQNWGDDMTYARKIKELILAVDLEREYSKEDILTGYLNLAPFGPVQNGVEAAAQDYFGVKAKDLSLAQAAFLAAIPKSPAVYSPYGPYYEEEELIGRMHYILDRMAEQRTKDGKLFITKKQAEDAKKENLLSTVKPRSENKYENIKAPYFVMAAKAQLEEQRGKAAVERGGWKVITTVDMDLQTVAEQEVEKNRRVVQRQGGDQQAFVASDTETGQIVALVGGVDFNNQEYGKINYATEVNVSPGSTFKPYDYAAFVDNNNAGAGSVMYDIQGALPQYPCTIKQTPKSNPDANCLWDYDLKYPGPTTLRYALGGSRNVPAVKAMVSAVPNDTSNGRIDSINKTISVAEGMMGSDNGYRCYVSGTEIFTAKKTDETQCYASSAIGDGAYLHLDDHVNGIASFGRNGKSLPKSYILKVTDSNNKTVYEWKKTEGKQVIKADTAFVINDIMADPAASYMSGANKFHRYNGWNFAIKTGTTNDQYDGLLASWSSKYAVVTWVGYHTRNKAMTGFMETMTVPVVRSWMRAAHDKLNTDPVNFSKPASIKTSPAYVMRSRFNNGATFPSTGNDVYPSWYTPKTANGNNSSNVTIDKVSKKTATECTPELAREQQNNSSTDQFSVDVFVGAGTNVASTEVDDIHNCSDTKPQVGLINVEPVSGSGSCSVGVACRISVTPLQGTHAIVGGDAGGGVVRVAINGTEVGTGTISSSGVPISITYTPTVSGPLTITATVIDSVLYSGAATRDVTISGM